MAEYSKLARGSFTYGGPAGTPQIISLPFKPQKVEVWDYTTWSYPNGGVNFYTYWDSSLPQGAGMNEIWQSTGTTPPTAYVSTSVQTTNCISVYSDGPGVIYGPTQAVQAMTAANPVVVTVPNHGYQNGDVVVFEGLYQSRSPATGMAQICSIPFVISAVSTNNFTVLWDGSGSNYTALSGSPAGATVRQIINPNSYMPNVGFISFILRGATTNFNVTNTVTYSIGQLVAFRIPPIWGIIQLNAGQNPNFPGFVMYGTVTAISGQQITVNIDSTNFTAWANNPSINSVPGLTPAQVVPVGDLNSGTSTLFSSSTNGSPTIDGAFQNNTSKGFIIGSNSLLNTASGGDKILWEATYYDYVQDM